MNKLEVESVPQRPVGVTILAILAVIAALLCTLSIFSFITYLSVSSMIGSSMPMVFIVIFALVLIFLIVVFLLIAYGFWKGLRWSWFLAVIFCITMVVLQIAMVMFSVSIGLFTTPFMMSETFQLFQLLMVTRFIIALVIYGIIMFYLTRSKVRSYFNLGQPGDILKTIQSNKKPIIIILSLIAIIAIILIWGFTPTGEITVLSITQTPENPQPGDTITVTAEITGGSSFGGAGPYITYSTIRKSGGGTGSTPMESIGNNKYSWTTYGGNGTVIWYMIFSGNNLIADNAIQVDFNDESTTLPTITNINQIPEQPTSDTEKIEISVDINSNYNITRKKVPFKYKSGSLSGGSSTDLTFIEGTTYKITFTPNTIHGMGLFVTDNQDHEFQKGTNIYYRIVIFDEANNAAVSPTQIITIS